MSEEQNNIEQGADSLDSISSALAALDGMGGTAEGFIDDLRKDESLSFLEGNSQETVNEQPQGEEASEATENTTQSQDAGTEAANTAEEGETSEEESGGLIIESDIFGTEKFGEENEEESTVAPAEAVSKFFKENDFGISEDNFSEKIPELVNKAQEYDNVAKTVKSYEDVFNNMPLELHEAIKSFYNNESDWDRHVKERIALSFDKNFDDLNSKDVVSKYFPNQISEEDWEEYEDPDGDERVKKMVDNYINVSKDKFVSDKNVYNQRVQEAQNSTKVYQENFQKSFDSSRAKLEDVFKDKMPNEVYLNTIDQEIKQNSVVSLFYNEDGTLKPDAHARYIYARDGGDLIKKQREAIKRAVASKERESIIMRTADSPTVSKTDSTVMNSEQELENRVKSQVDNVLPEVKTGMFEA